MQRAGRAREGAAVRPSTALQDAWDTESIMAAGFPTCTALRVCMGEECTFYHQHGRLADPVVRSLSGEIRYQLLPRMWWWGGTAETWLTSRSVPSLSYDGRGDVIRRLSRVIHSSARHDIRMTVCALTSNGTAHIH